MLKSRFIQMVKVVVLALCVVSAAGSSGCRTETRMVIRGKWYYVYDSNGNSVRFCFPPGNECEFSVRIK